MAFGALVHRKQKKILVMSVFVREAAVIAKEKVAEGGMLN
jgi:hypothetical protein